MDIRKYIRSVVQEELISKKPITLAYHGTPHGDFDKFDMSKRGQGADMSGFGDYGKGFYFTPYKEEAESYARNLAINKGEEANQPTVYTVHLNIQNPFNFDILVQYNEAIRPLYRKYGMLNIPDEEYQKIYKDLNTTEEEIDFIQDLESELNGNWSDSDTTGILQKKGYDGIISHDGSEIVAFKPNQIKIIKKERLS